MSFTAPQVSGSGLDAAAASPPGAPPPGGPPDEAELVQGLGTTSLSQRQMVVRRFLRHRAAMVALITLVVVVVMALVGGKVWKWPYQGIGSFDSTCLSCSPTTDFFNHPMGTDGIGSDIFAQVLRGAQASVSIMLVVALLSTGLGVVVGGIAGYYRGWVDAILMRIVDLLLTIPGLLVLVVLARVGANPRSPLTKYVLRYFGSGGGSWLRIAVIIALLAWMPVARVVRAEVLSLREKEFAEAARALGAGDLRIIFKHLIPNAVGTIIVSATLIMAVAILTETTLSYLGFGVTAPDTSLGLLVSAGQTAAFTRWWLFYFPGLFIIVIVLCVNFVGDGLRDAFDPKQNKVRA
ncbi:MAG: ABC transporter permease [Actinobacteria bacterium]|nr:ABC transporter permease [Actinomycetota bacterium]